MERGRAAWLQSAIDSGLVNVVKHSRLRGSNSAAVPKEQFKCASPCMWLFDGNTTEEQYTPTIDLFW
ncbi:hypothetical protein OAO87_04180 [bacterium]|nr:hypothetical protein [bacterium]